MKAIVQFGQIFKDEQVWVKDDVIDIEPDLFGKLGAQVKAFKEPAPEPVLPQEKEPVKVSESPKDLKKPQKVSE